jgi:hypothetical protein
MLTSRTVPVSFFRFWQTTQHQLGQRRGLEKRNA